MSIFEVKNNETINVSVDYLVLPNGDLAIITNPEFKKENAGKIKTATATFKIPDWSTFNTYTNGCLKTDQESGQQYVDPTLLRDKKLKSLLTRLVDGDGSEIQITKNFFTKVKPEFALALTAGFDEAIYNRRIDALREAGVLDEDKEEEKKEEEKDDSSN